MSKPVVRVHSTIQGIPEQDWNGLVGAEGSPFLEWRWLEALERSGSASPDTGWVPRHVGIWEGEELVAAAPVYAKTHSMGEFVYDWSWANAASQLGVGYYPKLIVGVPFTPATGSRLLAREPRHRELLVAVLLRLARELECHGLHVLFCTEEESLLLEGLGGDTRLQFQFHWTNQGYTDFEDFLARGLKSKRRTELRRERRRLAETGVRVVRVEGEQIQPEQLAAMHRFYKNTCWQFGGNQYLNRSLWGQLLESFGDRVHLVLAYDGERPIAGAFNVQKGDTLYGRYWGCSEERRYLHFEVCYYQAIEHCIARGLKTFEPGHGGGHKYPRGFSPALCYSSHWLEDPRLSAAIRQHLVGERASVRRRVQELREALD